MRIILALLLSLSVPSQAAIYSGKALMELVPGYNRVSGQGSAGATDYMAAAELKSYVAGVFDATQGLAIYCSPQNTSEGQVSKVVALYLDSHPEQLSLPASDIILQALKEAFPCSM